MLSGRRLLWAPVSGWHGGLIFPSAGNTGARLPSLTTISGATTAATAGGANTGWSYNGTAFTIGANAVLDRLNYNGGITVGASGVRISNCNVFGGGGGELTINGGVAGTTVSNCAFTDNSGNPNSVQVITLSPSGGVTTNTTFSDCTIAGGDATANRIAYGIRDISGGGATGLVIQRCNIFYYKQGLQIASGLVQDCYIHDPGFQTGDHSECAVLDGVPDGVTITFRHNTLWHNYQETAAIQTNTTASPFSNPNQGMTITGNLLAGGDYALYCGNSAPLNTPARNWQITDTGCTISSGTTLTDAALNPATDSGATVTGTGVPAGTTIVPGSISGSTATLSQACTNGAVSGGVTFHYTNNIVVTGNYFSNSRLGGGGQLGYSVNFDTAVASNIWSGNVVYETLAAIASPNT